MEACVETVAPPLPVDFTLADRDQTASSSRFSQRAAWSAKGWWRFGNPRASEKIPQIVHVDLGAFFASVEQAQNPGLRGKPVLVGRSAVASASDEAKFYGVKTAMTIREALRICPQAIVVPGKYEHYAEFAERVRRILETYTSNVETAALDDFYLAFAGTERLSFDFEATLRRMRTEIRARTGLDVTIGAGRTKVVASIASRLGRPRGFRIVPPGTEEAFLAPLPVDNLQGIGHGNAAALVQRGIATIGQLRMIPKPVLVAAFGLGIGEQIWKCARGLNGHEDMTRATPKSVLRETTIEGGTTNREFLGGLLEYLSERIGSALREDGMRARTLDVSLRYVDHLSARQTIRLLRATSDVREFHAAGKELLASLFARPVAIRQVTLSVKNLEATLRQNELFDTEANRRRHPNLQLDRAGARYGRNAVVFAKILELRKQFAVQQNRAT